MLGVEVHSPTLNKQFDLMLHKYGCIWNAQKFVPNNQQPESTVRLQQHLKTILQCLFFTLTEHSKWYKNVNTLYYIIMQNIKLNHE